MDSRHVPSVCRRTGRRGTRARPLAATVSIVTLAVFLALAPGPVPAAQAASPVATAEAAGTAVTSTETTTSDPVLSAGQTLQAGERRTSADGRDVLVMQGDGNLVLYSAGKARWSSRTMGNPGARLVFQDDYNLVVYSASNRVLWTSATHRHPYTSAYLRHGELSLVRGEDVWTTRSGHDRLQTGGTLLPGQSLVGRPYPWDRPSRLVMQADGNLVHYGSDGQVYWHTRTYGNPGARAVMQGDGNLVVYARDGRPLWASRTRGAGLTVAVEPYTRGYWSDAPDRVLYLAGRVAIVDPGDRPVAGYPSL